jgi:hypothetical protein
MTRKKENINKFHLEELVVLSGGLEAFHGP